MEKKKKRGINYLKILSWNINGLKSALKDGFENTIKELDDDIICIQEKK